MLQSDGPDSLAEPKACYLYPRGGGKRSTGQRLPPCYQTNLTAALKKSKRLGRRQNLNRQVVDLEVIHNTHRSRRLSSYVSMPNNNSRSNDVRLYVVAHSVFWLMLDFDDPLGSVFTCVIIQKLTQAKVNNWLTGMLSCITKINNIILVIIIIIIIKPPKGSGMLCNLCRWTVGIAAQGFFLHKYSQFLR